jgi:hypothetical protein
MTTARPEAGTHTGAGDAAMVLGGGYNQASTQRRARFSASGITTTLAPPQRCTPPPSEHGHRADDQPARGPSAEVSKREEEEEAANPHLQPMSAVARAIAAAEQQTQRAPSTAPPRSSPTANSGLSQSAPRAALPSTPVSRVSAVPAHLQSDASSSRLASSSPASSPLALSSPASRVVNRKLSLLSEMERLQKQLDTEMDALQATRQRLASLVEQGRER